MEAIILAGGKGTRLRSKISDVPKPMAPVHGRPFLAHLLGYWINQGVDRFVLSVGYLHESITKWFGESHLGTPLSYAIEPSALGTGGGLLLALEKLQTRTTALVLNGDSFFALDLKTFKGFHDERKSLFSIALAQVSRNSRYGEVELDAECRCLSLREPGSGASKRSVNGGVYLIEPDFVATWSGMPHGSKQPSEAGFRPLSLEKEMLPQWITQGDRIYGWESSGRFLDIGTPEDYEKAQTFLGDR